MALRAHANEQECCSGHLSTQMQCRSFEVHRAGIGKPLWPADEALRCHVSSTVSSENPPGLDGIINVKVITNHRQGDNGDLPLSQCDPAPDGICAAPFTGSSFSTICADYGFS